MTSNMNDVSVASCFPTLVLLSEKIQQKTLSQLLRFIISTYNSSLQTTSINVSKNLMKKLLNTPEANLILKITHPRTYYWLGQVSKPSLAILFYKQITNLPCSQSTGSYCLGANNFMFYTTHQWNSHLDLKQILLTISIHQRVKKFIYGFESPTNYKQSPGLM